MQNKTCTVQYIKMQGFPCCSNNSKITKVLHEVRKWNAQCWGAVCRSNMCRYNMWEACWMSLMVSEPRRQQPKRYNVAWWGTKHIEVVQRHRTRIGVHRSMSDAYRMGQMGRTSLYEGVKSWGVQGNVPWSDHVDLRACSMSGPISETQRVPPGFVKTGSIHRKTIWR
jgi:hypothetical protein